MALFNNIFSQNPYAPPPNFNFGPNGPNCGPCGSNPVATLPEQPPAPTPNNPNPCNPTQIPPTFNPQPSGQPHIPTNPLPILGQRGFNPLNPSGPQRGIIWPGPQPGPLGGGWTGKSPPQPGQPILWNPKPNEPTTTPTPPYKYIPPQNQDPLNPPPNPNVPNCGLTSGPTMPGLETAPSSYLGWPNNGSANLPYQMMQGTGIPVTAWGVTKVAVIPTVATSPYMNSAMPRPFFLPNEYPPQQVAMCNGCIV